MLYILLLIIPLIISSFVFFSFLCFYTDDNTGDESKMNTIKINNGTATCIKCGSPFQKAEEIQNIPPAMANLFNNTNKGETDAGAAA